MMTIQETGSPDEDPFDNVDCAALDQEAYHKRTRETASRPWKPLYEPRDDDPLPYWFIWVIVLLLIGLFSRIFYMGVWG